MVVVGEMSTGSEVAIPVVVVRGRRDGPCAFIAAGMHTEETGCIEAVKRFSAQITPDQVTGTLVLVPLQNAPAWAHRSRLYPFDAPSVLDLTGLKKPDAEGVMTATVLYALVEYIAAHADYGLDIHALSSARSRGDTAVG